MAKDGDDRPYDVGKGKPPRWGQFKKGLSGNLKGRPRKAKNAPAATGNDTNNARDLVLRDAQKPLKIRMPEGETSISSYEAVLQANKASALKGNPHAQRLYLNRVEKAQQQEQEVWEELKDNIYKYKQHHEKIVREVAKRNLSDTIFLAHPDDIRLMPEFKTIGYIGPSDFEEQRKLDGMVLFRNYLAQALGWWDFIKCEPGLKDYIADCISARYHAVTVLSARFPPRYAASPIKELVVNTAIREVKWTDPVLTFCLMPIPPQIVKMFERNPEAKADFFNPMNFPLGPDRIPINDSPYFRCMFGEHISGKPKQQLISRLDRIRRSRRPMDGISKLVDSKESYPPYVWWNAAGAYRMREIWGEAGVIDFIEASL